MTNYWQANEAKGFLLPNITGLTESEFNAKQLNEHRIGQTPLLRLLQDTVSHFETCGR
jgi:hypothetical protein